MIFQLLQNAFNILGRGYTGHEHLLEHDIINMNGRIYDPILGQFMQADNNKVAFNKFLDTSFCHIL